MKLKMVIETEVEAAAIRVSVPVRYGTEDIPADFPLRDGDWWEAVIDIDTGRIRNWPLGKAGDLDMKVCDEGTYQLLDAAGKQIAIIRGDYVPPCVPGECGDYVSLNIDPTGLVTNWAERCTPRNLRRSFGHDQAAD